VKKVDATPELFMQIDGWQHPDNEWLEKETQFGLLSDCLDRLAEEQKTSITLFYLEKKCYQEIAAITGYEWGKVRSYIQNGRRNLKQCMKDKEEEPDA
jgi:RNA polymerase sigma-70 factor (ECF subfamily)